MYLMCTIHNKPLWVWVRGCARSRGVGWGLCMGGRLKGGVSFSFSFSVYSLVGKGQGSGEVGLQLTQILGLGEVPSNFKHVLESD